MSKAFTSCAEVGSTGLPAGGSEFQKLVGEKKRKCPVAPAACWLSVSGAVAVSVGVAAELVADVDELSVDVELLRDEGLRGLE
ncbi:MAG TPA: hypothetical protein VFP23_01365 [Solirubrobacterales bacterium]|nr:hypothetical protein [Solirubrobacterales bacterium]